MLLYNVAKELKWVFFLLPQITLVRSSNNYRMYGSMH